MTAGGQPASPLCRKLQTVCGGRAPWLFQMRGALWTERLLGQAFPPILYPSCQCPTEQSGAVPPAHSFLIKTLGSHTKNGRRQH